MYVDTMKLRGKIAELDLTLAQYAAAIGINPSTLHRKFQTDCVSLTIGQIHKSVETLSLTKAEAGDIFFADKLA